MTESKTDCNGKRQNRTEQNTESEQRDGIEQDFARLLYQI